LRRALVLTLLAGLATAAPASAGGGYPPPGDPGTATGHPKGKLTLRVCKRYHKLSATRYRSIQKAIDYAGPGDTIRVCHGVYRGGVKIESRRKRSLKLIGDPGNPRKVVIDLKGAKGVRAQNGVFINRSDDVTVSGFYARNYKGNGFFALSVTGYAFTHLVAGYGGAYGIYAFDSIGGSMTDSEAFYNNDAGFYVGQTPRQAKPLATYVRRGRAWGNVLGFSGTNMRYTRILDSKWFNNGLGIVPNTLSTEKFPPEEDNLIRGNDIFWNNFNYFRGAPFKRKKGTQDAGDFAYPVGTGVLLFGGRRNVVTGNRIYGNYLVGVGMTPQVVLAQSKKTSVRAASVIVGNEIRGNSYGLGGADLNGRDVFAEGSGRDNCVDETGPLRGPVGASTFRPCPFQGANTPDATALAAGISWVVARDHEKFWIRSPHKAKPGYTPLERCRKTKAGCQGQPRR
jgi:hypothetical protein